MNLAQAELIARALVAELEPYTERLEVAGSVRRQKADVKDIELVAIPRYEERESVGQAGLFGETPPPTQVNLLHQALTALDAEGDRVQTIKPGTHNIVRWPLNPDGRYWRLWLPKPALKVDLFVCNAETWGLNLMIRTGSGVGPDGNPQHGFAPAMLARWKQVSGGGFSHEAQLRTPAGATIRTPEEQDVFDAIKVRWVPPSQRVSSRDVERNALP